MSVKSCSDTTEAVALESSLGLYLKPVSKIKINVQLPKLTIPGQSISSWHVMEKLKATVRPDTFLYLKALKITSNVIKFEGELETKASCERALARLRAASNLKLSGFAERLQIRAAHATCSGPTRHDWEAFFRDAKGVNEMKPGERPDTIHLEEMPVRWFTESSKSIKPSEKILRKAFESFGKIRRLEIPKNVASENNTFGKTSSLHSDLLFEAYIQYEEYVEFSIAMDSLRGKKLLYKEPDGKVYAADIKVDFDRTNYLSDKCIKRREAEAKKLNPVHFPEKKKVNSTDDAHKDSTISKSTIVSEKSLVVEIKTNAQVNSSDKNITTKDKTEEQNSDLKKKSQKEATLLLKELLNRAEKHERRKEKVKQMGVCPGEKTSKNNQKMDTLHFQKDLKTKKLSSSHIEKESKQSKELLERNKTEKQLEIVNKVGPVILSKCVNKHKLNEEDLGNRKKILCGEKEKSRVKHKKESDKKPDVTREEKQNKKEQTRASNDVKRLKEKRLLSQNGETKSKERKNLPNYKDKKEKYTHLYYEEKKMKESIVKVNNEEKKNKEKLILQERILKEKLLLKLKARQEEKLKLREKLRKELAGRKVLKSVLADTNHSSHRRT